MNQKLLSFFAGIGILAIVFVACANTTSSKLENSLDFIEIGVTYKTEFEGSGYRIKILEMKGNWVRAEAKSGWERDSESQSMWINLNQLAYIK